jgi:hypothetical protein
MVALHAQIAAAHADLEQSRVEVDQRRAPEARYDRVRRFVGEVDEQVALIRGRLEIQPAASQVGEDLASAEIRQRQPGTEPPALEPLLERG